MENKSTITERLASLREGALVQGLPEGLPLSLQERALVRMGLAASVTSLNLEAIRSAIDECFASGASPQQIQEMVSLVSGLGVHSLMVTATEIVGRARELGHELGGTMSEAEAAIWRARIGDDPYWTNMEAEIPGFLRSLLALSPRQFEVFFDYCAVPWQNGAVRARVKELLAMACDATPSHIFTAGFRLHLRNAIKLGAGRLAIDECLALAAAAPLHEGIGPR